MLLNYNRELDLDMSGGVNDASEDMLRMTDIRNKAIEANMILCKENLSILRQDLIDRNEKGVKLHNNHLKRYAETLSILRLNKFAGYYPTMDDLDNLDAIVNGIIKSIKG